MDSLLSGRIKKNGVHLLPSYFIVSMPRINLFTIKLGNQWVLSWFLVCNCLVISSVLVLLLLFKEIDSRGLVKKEYLIIILG